MLWGFSVCAAESAYLGAVKHALKVSGGVALSVGHLGAVGAHRDQELVKRPRGIWQRVWTIACV